MEISLPKKHQWVFWLILAALSTFFAEVFSGSDMFPFFSAWGLLVVVPLYGLHTILLGSLIYRADKPRFPSLVFAGMIFGLYEAYLTKVLWAPPWGDPVIIAEFAPVETLVLVTWWHCWFSFIIPLLVAEKLLTNSTSLGRCLPGKLGDFLSPRHHRRVLAGISTIDLCAEQEPMRRAVKAEKIVSSIRHLRCRAAKPTYIFFIGFIFS